MGARNVDIVFVIDASDSMSPCIDSVKKNISKMLDELGQASYTVRLDMLVHNMPGRGVYMLNSIHQQGIPLLNALYKDESGRFFTDSVSEFTKALDDVQVRGDEDMLLALDTAFDYPFGPAKNTQRVVVLLSDEPFETNYCFDEHAEDYRKKANEMVDKIHDRHISLFMVMPSSEIAQTLAEADRADYAILQEGDTGLRSFNFSRFFSQLGKTISVTTAQQSHEKPYHKSIMGQAEFSRAGMFKSIGDMGGR